MADNPTPKSGKFAFDPIKSPKQEESSDGILEPTGPTAPAGAAKPKK